VGWDDDAVESDVDETVDDSDAVCNDDDDDVSDDVDADWMGVRYCLSIS